MATQHSTSVQERRRVLVSRFRLRTHTQDHIAQEWLQSYDFFFRHIDPENTRGYKKAVLNGGKIAMKEILETLPSEHGPALNAVITVIRKDLAI